MTENTFSICTCWFVAASLLFVLVFVAGCSTKEPVIIQAGDVSYGSKDNKTVKDALDEINKAQGTKAHTHKASEITGLDSAVVNAMGVKTNLNPLKHDRYGEADLKASATIKALDTRVTKLEGGSTTPTPSSECPAGYKKAVPPTGKSWVICTKSAGGVLDEMAKVGDFWVDRYETVVVRNSCGSKNPIDFYTNSLGNYAEAGLWKTGSNLKLFSCSTKNLLTVGLPPSGYMTYYQAQMVCNNAGKHLCTNAEWQMAAAGTDTTNANTNTSARVKVGTTGSVSHWGAYDMVGNVAEWVAGMVIDGTSTQAKALLRGGSYDDSAATGIDHIRVFSPTLKNDTKRPAKGARCCISGGG